MKKITSLILVCVMLVGCVFAFASCAMRFGKYESELNIGIASYKVTLEFSFNNIKVTQKAKALGSSDTNVYEGSFNITGEGEDMEISFEFEEDCPVFSADSYEFEEGEDDDGKFVRIGVTKYYEVK